MRIFLRNLLFTLPVFLLSPLIYLIQAIIFINVISDAGNMALPELKYFKNRITHTKFHEISNRSSG